MARKWIDLNDLAGSQRAAVEAVWGGEPNAEWKLLTLWATMQMEGIPLEPEFERAATVLLVPAIAHWKLPAKRGRPELKPVDNSDSQVSTLQKSASGARGKPRTPRQMRAEYNERMEELEIKVADMSPEERPSESEMHETVIAQLGEWTGKDGQVVESWLKRADDDWTSSPQMAQNFLAGTFRAKGKGAFKKNDTLLAFTRIRAEKQRLKSLAKTERLKGANEVVKVDK